MKTATAKSIARKVAMTQKRVPAVTSWRAILCTLALSDAPHFVDNQLPFSYLSDYKTAALPLS